MRKTKIVCTIGPSCETVEAISELIGAGMNVARLNFSHSTHAEHRQRIATIRRAEAQRGTRIAILIDSRGPELRTGKVPSGLQVQLQRGQRVTIDCAATEVSATTSTSGGTIKDGGKGKDSTNGTESNSNDGSDSKDGSDNTAWTVPVNYSFLPSLVTLGTHLYIADGLIGLSIDDKDARTITCTVVNGGVLGSYKNINIPGLALPIPTVSDHDLQDIAFGIDNGVDIIALSFVRRAQDVVPVREFLRSNNSEMAIVSKIENEVGVQHIEEIIDVSDGVMIARGDLGIQLPPERVALVQKEIIKQCNTTGKPVITATQMLESMTHHVRPTRAEMTDVANAIFDGSDAIMLSGETAVGRHPSLAVQTLHNIAMSVEHSEPYHDVMYRAAMQPTKMTKVKSNSEAVARATVQLSVSVKPQAIVVPTLRGTGPRWLSRFRPMPPIVAVTPSIAVSRRLQTMWGVYPVIAEKVSDTDAMLDNAFHIACQQNFVEYGEWAIVVAGVPLDSPTTLNYVTIRYHGKILQRGTNGVGERTAGKITLINDVADIERNTPHTIEIAVVPCIDEQCAAVLHTVRGIISERPPALPLQELKQRNPHIVVVAGVPNATSLFRNNQHVEINGSERLIYQSK